MTLWPWNLAAVLPSGTLRAVVLYGGVGWAMVVRRFEVHDMVRCAEGHLIVLLTDTDAEEIELRGCPKCEALTESAGTCLVRWFPELWPGPELLPGSEDGPNG
jgi:hypothetical protein